jgi:CRP-like cAMP-binding protein
MSLREVDSDLTAISYELCRRFSVSGRLYPAATSLLAQGLPSSYVYFIIHGAVKMSFLERSGREIISNVRSATCVVGADIAILGTSSPFEVTTLTECEVRQFSAERIRQLLRSDVSLAFHMSRSMARECLSQARATISLTPGGARQRLIDLLDQQRIGFKETGSGAVLCADLLLKKREIAKLLAITPEHLSRLIRALKHQGVLVRDKREIIFRRTKAKS